MLSSPFASLPAFNEILLLENWLELNWDFNPIDVVAWKCTLVGTFNGGSCNQKTLVFSSLTIMNLIKCSGPMPCARGSNFKVFDHPHLRHSFGRVWLLKFSSLLLHLSIATEAQNSHLGYSLFSSFTWRAGQYRLHNSWWHLREAPCGLLLRWTLLLSKLYSHYHYHSD